MDDQSVEAATLAVTFLTSSVCIATLPITISIILVLVREKTLFGRTFFTLYKVGLTTDVISIVTSLVLGVLPAVGWFVDAYMSTEVPRRLFYFFNWSTRVMQGFINTWICLNRATATLMPLTHRKARFIDGFVYDAGQKAIKRIAHFLKQTGKVKVPEWSDLVKLGVTKDMAPPTLTGSTSAPPLGLAACTSALPSQHLPYGSVIHKALKSLEALKWVDKSEDGKGRVLNKQGAPLGPAKCWDSENNEWKKYASCTMIYQSKLSG
uniref:G protein-coupled receptor n=1 Tax=Pristionchus pacificus TaxID=54126 RepID=A0A2A6CVN3_PRIPA|eukprot:PDM82160.1 G protein-coupled receptor [Pristionchus pacificus]